MSEQQHLDAEEDRAVDLQQWLDHLRSDFRVVSEIPLDDAVEAVKAIAKKMSVDMLVSPEVCESNIWAVINA